MNRPIVVTLPASPDGPAARRRRGDLPPPRQPRVNAFRLQKFAGRVFNEPDETEWRELASKDWREFLNRRFALTDTEKATLDTLDAESTSLIAKGIQQLIKSGGALTIALPEHGKSGELTLLGPGADSQLRSKKKAVAPSASGRAGASTNFNIPIVHCSFDANCRNWRCKWG